MKSSAERPAEVAGVVSRAPQAGRSLFRDGADMRRNNFNKSNGFNNFNNFNNFSKDAVRLGISRFSGGLAAVALLSVGACLDMPDELQSAMHLESVGSQQPGLPPDPSGRLELRFSRPLDLESVRAGGVLLQEWTYQPTGDSQCVAAQVCRGGVCVGGRCFLDPLRASDRTNLANGGDPVALLQVVEMKAQLADEDPRVLKLAAVRSLSVGSRYSVIASSRLRGIDGGYFAGSENWGSRFEFEVRAGSEQSSRLLRVWPPTGAGSIASDGIVAVAVEENAMPGAGSPEFGYVDALAETSGEESASEQEGEVPAQFSVAEPCDAFWQTQAQALWPDAQGRCWQSKPETPNGVAFENVRLEVQSETIAGLPFYWIADGEEDGFRWTTIPERRAELSWQVRRRGGCLEFVGERSAALAVEFSAGSQRFADSGWAGNFSFSTRLTPELAASTTVMARGRDAQGELDFGTSSWEKSTHDLPSAYYELYIAGVLANPSGSEPAQEWLAIGRVQSQVNQQPAQIRGLHLRDVGWQQVLDAVALGESHGGQALPDFTIAPGEIVFVAGPGFDVGNDRTPWSGLLKHSQVLRLEQSVGQRGLSNSGEPITLFLADPVEQIASYRGEVDVGALVDQIVVPGDRERCDRSGSWTLATK